MYCHFFVCAQNHLTQTNDKWIVYALALHFTFSRNILTSNCFQVDIVAKEVISFSKAYTYVLTSGGIGPTHDDLTFEAVASAFDDELIVHEDILKSLKKYFESESLTEGMIKLATVPKTAKLNFVPGNLNSKELSYPLVSVQVNPVRDNRINVNCSVDYAYMVYLLSVIFDYVEIYWSGFAN